MRHTGLARALVGRPRLSCIVMLAIALGLGVGWVSAATLVADYQFQDTRASSMGTPPDLVDIGPGGANSFATETVRGILTRVLTFPQDNGLSLSPTTGVIPSDSYTIVALFRFDNVGGFRRIVDFKNGASDCGFYVLSGRLNFFCAADGLGTPIAANTYVQVVLTRDSSTNLVVGYVNGVQNLSFTDSSSNAVINTNTLRFFRDNECVAPCGEDSAGAVSRLRLYDGPLTPGEVAVLEPSDHYLCYKVVSTKGSAKFVPVVVSLADQFDTVGRNFDVKKPASLCTPADKEGEGIIDANTHLERYQIALTKARPPQAADVKHAVRVTNQFGELLLTTGKSDRLLVPTAKSLTGPTDPPGPNHVNHYQCYKASVSKGAPKFVPIAGVRMSDQFTDLESQSPKRFDLKKPTRLCNPVNKDGDGIKSSDNHLLCYQATPVKGQPKHVPIKGQIQLNNQFGPGQVDTVKEEDLCVPSFKEDLGLLAADSVSESDGEEDEED